MTDYTYDQGYFSRRGLVFLAILGVHGLMIWAFVTGLVGNVVADLTQNVEVSLLSQKEEELKPPPPPKADLDIKPPPVAIPPPIVNIAMPVEAPIKVVTDKPPPPAPKPKPVAVVLKKPIDFRSPPDVERYYPELAKKQEQTGSPIIHFCVGADGKREGEPEVKTSSGFDLLDQAAVKLVRESRYTPAIGTDNKPLRACKDVKITFKMTSGG
ncbi:MAG: energy transducer TonB [Gammaproteobacteria bacterium]|nr:energy transducer TonB [Gammaproteobacteria bacterium]